MENKQRTLAICIIACLASLPLSSTFVTRDSDTSKNGEKNFDHELQNLIPEQRQQDIFLEKTDEPMNFEEKLPESKIIHDKRINEEEIDEKLNLIKPNSTTENIVQNAPTSYKNMHDVMHALMLADNEDIMERLQELRETKNSKEFETLNNLPKRQIATAAASASASAAVSSNHVFGVNLDGISINGLDIHSCEAEAFAQYHGHLSGTIVHELFCELRKLFHYFLIVTRDLASELTMGPLITEEYNDIEISSGGFFHQFKPIFNAFVREPHHLLILPEIIKDVVPFGSIQTAIYRFKHVFFKLLHFAYDVYVALKVAVFQPFLQHPVGIYVRDGLAARYHTKLHHLRGLGAQLPGEVVVTSSSTSAASVGSSASAASAASATTYSDAIISPKYHESLQEILASFKGFYNGYHASGMPQLFKSFSSSSAYTSVTSFISKMPFMNYFTPIETVTTSSASSISTAANISPVIAPMVPVVSAPIIPVVSSVPASAVSSSSVTATAAAASASAATAVPAETIVSYPSVYPVIEDVVASASSSASSVVESNQYKGYDLNINQPAYPFMQPTIIPPAISSSAAVASSASVSGASSVAASSTASSLVLPRQKIVSALGYDYLMPGDLVAIAFKKKGALLGHIVDALSPITFKFLKPKLYHSLIHKAGRVWSLTPQDFQDPGCLHQYNNPLYLQSL